MWTPLSCAVVATTLLQGCITTSSKSDASVGFGVAAAQQRVIRAEQAAAQARYRGFVKLSDSAKLPVVVDLTPDNKLGASRAMRAVVRLHLGSFDSSEFVSYYFPHVSGDSANRLTFGSSESDASSLAVTEARLDDDRFSAYIHIATNADGRRRPLSGFLQAIRLPANQFDRQDEPDSAASITALNKILAIESGSKTVEPVSGEYVAQCNGLTSVMQLDFARFTEGKKSGPFGFKGGMFGTGTITGRLGPEGQQSCIGDDQACDVRIFKAGSFEPFSGELVLKSSEGDLKCQVDHSSIYCDSCRFARRVGHTKLAVKQFRRSEEMTIESGPALKLETNPAALGGSFYGYLHHESSDMYQPVSLRLDYLAESMTYASVAALYFGDTNLNEFVVYQFDPVSIRQLAGQFVLDGPGESYLVLTSAGEKAVGGVWYSKTRGRIGTVSMARNSMPPLMVERSKLVGSLQGSYSSANWKIDLFVASNISETAGDYSALRIFGEATEVVDPSRQRLIRQGSFDFYTGTVAFKLDDGRVVHGAVRDGKLALYWPVWPKFGEGVTPREQLSFTRTSKPDQTIAARK